MIKPTECIFIYIIYSSLFPVLQEEFWSNPLKKPQSVLQMRFFYFLRQFLRSVGVKWWSWRSWSRRRNYTGNKILHRLCMFSWVTCSPSPSEEIDSSKLDCLLSGRRIVLSRTSSFLPFFLSFFLSFFQTSYRQAITGGNSSITFLVFDREDRVCVSLMM